MNHKKVDMAWPQGRIKAFTMTYDDGNDCDIRLVEIMRKYGVKGTFNINSGSCPPAPKENTGKQWHRMTMQEAVELYGDDMELAVHGYSHPFLPDMPTPQAVREILDDRRELERASGKIIRGCAYPFGRTNDDVCKILKLSGIAYSRITGSTGKVLLLPDDPYRWKTSCKHTDANLMDVARALVEDPAKRGVHQPLLMSVWGHSYEFVRDDNWNVIEELLDYVGNRDDIWYCTNIELFDYVAAYKELVFDMEQTKVYNPSAMDVWVRCRVKEPKQVVFVKVPSGETVELP